MTGFYLSAFLLSFVFSVLLVPYIARFARRWGAVDIPTVARKIHLKEIPLWGGLAIYLSFFLTLSFFCMSHPFFEEHGLKGIWGIFFGATLITITGVIDDRKGLPPKVKLFGQILSALILAGFGIRMHGMSVPFTDVYFVFPGIISWILTLIWVVLLVNAFNFIDGLDGLAGGITVIVSLTLFLIAQKLYGTVSAGPAENSNIYTVVFSTIVLAGAASGFLLYNFSPAWIFMGDTGSQFIGFLLAALTVTGVMKEAAALTVFIPVLVLGVPLLDTFAAVVRRLRRGLPISRADKNHIHHVLMKKGFSPRQVVLILYLVSIGFACLAYLLSKGR